MPVVVMTFDLKLFLHRCHALFQALFRRPLHNRCFTLCLQILFRQGPLTPSQLRYVYFRDDVEGVALRAASGMEDSWLDGSRESWLDHLLGVLLPLVEYVEMKQSMTYNMEPAPRRFIS